MASRDVGDFGSRCRFRTVKSWICPRQRGLAGFDDLALPMVDVNGGRISRKIVIGDSRAMPGKQPSPGSACLWLTVDAASPIAGRGRCGPGGFLGDRLGGGIGPLDRSAFGASAVVPTGEGLSTNFSASADAAGVTVGGRGRLSRLQGIPGRNLGRFIAVGASTGLTGWAAVVSSPEARLRLRFPRPARLRMPEPTMRSERICACDVSCGGGRCPALQEPRTIRAAVM